MYCTVEDLLEVMAVEVLTDLVNDENDQDADVTEETDVRYARVMAGIGRAESEIDAYLRARYGLPLVSVPGLIKDIAVDLAIYHIYARRHRAEMPESITSNYKQRLQMLRDVQSGKIGLGAETPGVNDNTAWARTNKDAVDRVFPKTTLDTF